MMDRVGGPDFHEPPCIEHADAEVHFLPLVEKDLPVPAKVQEQLAPYRVTVPLFGLQADIEHMKDRMTREKYRFSI
ncbi:MAG: hypothetical protein EBS48_11170, partial [Actinobacteria bacterium]|nr:hypothetical protein [Actinomycetota bacterium]